MPLIKFSLLCVFTLTMACTREKGGASKVVFQLPDPQSLQKISDFSSDDGPDLSELNCFYVAVAGPEPELSNLRCGRKNLLSEMEMILQVGIVFGGVVRSSATQSIEIEVPSGEKRNFYLLASKQDDVGNCVDFSRNKSFYKDATNMLSKVWIVGRSEGNSLSAGAVQTIPMELKTHENDWLRECEGSPIREPVLNANLPSHLVLNKVGSPTGQKMQWNTCNAVEVELRNPLGQAQPATAPIVVQFLDRKTLAGATSVDFTPVESYASFHDCDDQLSAAQDFTISAGTNNVMRWIRAPASSGYVGTIYQMRVQTDSPVVKGVAFRRDQETAQFQMFEDSAGITHLEINGPRLVLKGQCYTYDVKRASTSGTAHTPVAFRVSGKIQGNKIVAREYTSETCSTELSEAAAATTARSQFFVKFEMDSGSYPVDFHLTQVEFGIPTSPLATGSFYEIQVLGNDTREGFKLRLPRMVKRPASSMQDCIPVRIQSTNAYGAMIPSSTTVTSTWNFTIIDVSPGAAFPHPIQFYSDSTCSTTLANAVTIHQFGGGLVFLKIYDTGSIATSLGPREIRLIRHPDTIFEDSQPFYVY
ncbi:MAG: hypothetical protein K2Q26_07000 [Bdellovibrionales bacterium]|nr:hypothetical protein [Bdellovibrionales bacterium]